MITVHHLENSRSQRILWLLEELKLEYEVITYQRDPQSAAAPASLYKIHPLGKSPIMVDDGVTLVESAAIIEYLLDRYDHDTRLRPTSGQALLDYRFWLHFAEGSLMPLLVMKLVMMKVVQTPMPFFAKPVARKVSHQVQTNFISPRLATQLDFIEKTLSERLWLTGDSLSAADIQMSFPLIAASGRVDVTAYPHIQAFVARVNKEPGYQAAIAKGGTLTTL